jgi:hypothetical protein
MLGHGYHETQEPIANLWPPGTGGCVAVTLNSSALYSTVLLHTLPVFTTYGMPLHVSAAAPEHS